jgi:rfaE bifunctional protein kinase chain/domain
MNTNTELNMPINKTRLKDLVTKFHQAKILIIGDLILDEYLTGTPERISREAPVIILKYLNSKFALGGSANAAAGTSALGAKTTLIGVLGQDSSANTFKNICQNLNIDIKPIIESDRMTTVKTRIVSSSNKNPDAGTSQKQQVLRIDREEKKELTLQSQKALLDCVLSEIQKNDIVLISDYGNGVLDKSTSQKIIEIANAQNKKSIVDSNDSFDKFPRAYCLTPNQPDLENNLGIEIKNELELSESAKKLKQKLMVEELLVTRGAKGMALFGKDSEKFIPAFNLSEVFDVTGAGDTVAGTYSLGLAVGASSYEAALLGNLAASIAVRKYGTATVSDIELIELIDKI